MHLKNNFISYKQILSMYALYNTKFNSQTAIKNILAIFNPH